MLKHNFLRVLLVCSIMLPAIAQEPAIQCNVQFNFCIDQCSNDECFNKYEIALENCYDQESERSEPEDDNENMPHKDTENDAQEATPDTVE